MTWPLILNINKPQLIVDNIGSKYHKFEIIYVTE